MEKMFKCCNCGYDTPNSRQVMDADRTEVLFTTHLCDKCHERFMQELDFQSDGETTRETDLICPWCQTSMDDYDACGYEEGGTEEVECPFCGKKFDLEVETCRRYSTRRSLCEMPDDYGQEEE